LPLFAAVLGVLLIGGYVAFLVSRRDRRTDQPSSGGV
jgi:hypothetical protein